MLRNVVFLMLLLVFPSVYGQKLSQQDPALFAEIRDNTLTPFITALKAGDVDQLRNYLSRDIYETEFKRLFEQNDSYPRFLRQYYESMHFTVSEILLDEADGIAEVQAYWEDGRTATLKLELSRTTDDTATPDSLDWVITSFPR